MGRGAVAVLMLATILRLMRAACRWEEWALHYAAYNLPTYEALQSGAYLEMLQTWVGLHPPLYPILHSVGSSISSSPATWLLFSTLCSLLAVGFMLAAHPESRMPALLLATDPVQLHYAAEVNNYPLSIMLISMAWWAHKTNRAPVIAVAGCFAVWNHVMGAFAVGAIALCNPRRFSILLPMVLVTMPLLGPAWQLASDAGSQRQPPLLLEATASDAIDRFSIGWVILFPIVLLGLARARVAAIGWVSCMAFWTFMVSLGLAAPHQFPYATVLGVFAAVLLHSATLQRPLLAGLVLLAAIGRSAWFALDDAGRLASIYADQSNWRGIDAVWELSLPGDAIVLVRGPGAPDDDRRHTSPTLWRLSPFESMVPLSTGIRPDLAGQPRLIKGRRLYTFSHPRTAIGTIPGTTVFTVLYDGAEQNPERIPDHPRQGPWKAVGPDLWRGPDFSPADRVPDAAPMDAESDGSQPSPPVSD